MTTQAQFTLTTHAKGTYSDALLVAEAHLLKFLDLPEDGDYHGVAQDVDHDIKETSEEEDFGDNDWTYIITTRGRIKS